MSSLLDDLRLSLRALSRKPLLAAVAVVTLALGIGVNAAMFSVIDAAVLSPLPYPEPERLARIYSTYEGRLCCPLSAPNFQDVRAASTGFADLVGFSNRVFTVTGGDEPARLTGYAVTAGFFEMFGARPQAGRLIGEADDRGGAEPVVVLSDRLWRDRHAADPGVVGDVMVIDSVPHTVIGVAPPGFRVTGRPELFTAFAWTEETLPPRGNNFLPTIGRLADGTSLDAAMEELSAIYGDLAREHDLVNDGIGALPLDEWLVGSGRRRPLLVLWGAVAMVLLVACVNVVNLMLARAESRQRELAVRSALGAGRGRLVRHFLGESLLLSLAGGALGVAAAWGGLRVLLSTFGGAVPRADDVTVDATVLGFSLLVALLTGGLVGLVPALQLRTDRLQRALREGGRGAAGRQSRLRQGLVVVEVGLALVLVVGAGLLLKSLWRLGQVEPGIETERVLTASVSLPAARYAETPQYVGFFETLQQELARLPGVEGAGIVSAAPFSGAYTNYSRIVPKANVELEASFVEVRTVDPSYFPAVRLTLRQGRIFTSGDDADAPSVVVINRELERQIFPEGDAVGQLIAPDPESDGFQVVGVVSDLRDHGPDVPVPPTIHFPFRQSPRRGMSVIVRTAGDPLDLAPEVRAAVQRLDPELPVYEVARLDQLVDGGLESRRFLLSLLATFAALALVLGAVGIYGVMAYTVEHRTREIGLRQALGATRATVLRLVIGQGAALAGVGIVLGLVGAFLLRRTMSGMVFEISTLDPSVHLSVAVVLGLVAVTACAIPALRAASVEPLEALREE